MIIKQEDVDWSIKAGMVTAIAKSNPDGPDPKTVTRAAAVLGAHYDTKDIFGYTDPTKSPIIELLVYLDELLSLTRVNSIQDSNTRLAITAIRQTIYAMMHKIDPGEFRMKSFETDSVAAAVNLVDMLIKSRAETQGV
jgi:hypothetical protein